MISSNGLTITEAIANKIISHCQENNMSINEFASKCNLTQSTIQNIINKKTQNIKIKTVYYLCSGMNMSLAEFFQDDIFRNIYLNSNLF